jgi:bla regulator protein blaR1
MSLAASILVKVTVTMALALLATRMARSGRASVRHVLLAASFAILVALPIATLVAPPVRISVPIAPKSAGALAVIDSMTTFVAVEAPRSIEARTTATSRRALSPGSMLLALWIAGALLFLLPVVVGLSRTRSLRRTALPWIRGQSIAQGVISDSGMRPRVDILLHDAVPGPMTCGVVNAAIVLPMDASSWSDEDLHRAIVHEVEHVRRADWLTQSMARTVAACYWFHPLVWMAWRQLALEAERACDDAVLQWAAPDAYADQLVMLAQRMLDKRSVSLAMASRTDLLARVRALLNSRQRRGPAGMVWIAVACAITMALIVSISPLRIVTAAQQPTDTRAQTFEVASVKPCKEEPNTSGQRRPEWRMPSPGRVSIECIALDRIIYFAYAGIGDMQNPLLNTSPSNPDHIRGGPGWIRAERFTIDAKAADAADRTVMMGPMLRALLEERFHLTTHRETEQAPMYALTVAKGGLKIKAIADNGCADAETVRNLSREDLVAMNNGPRPVCGSYTSVGDRANRTWKLGGITLARFASQILSSVLDRYVIDETGVRGLFNINLTFGLDESIRKGVFGGASVNPPPPDAERGPSIFTSLEEQLGLKLEQTKGPRQFLVIDRVQRPDPD